MRDPIPMTDLTREPMPLRLLAVERMTAWEKLRLWLVAWLFGQ